ncbi:MAG: hypothetical protein A4E28_00501 [Methanocella sp. PtaU1.Bin125]|nr:MAG: hypothetical protein A4E28_00501 [Methanocella sp. PtaU1.Bin125]
MAAIDNLLNAAGELSQAGLTGWAPLLDEMADVQASVAEALLPMLAAGTIGTEPFRYGFQLPPGPPQLKPEEGEPTGKADPPGVNVGPINVYAVAREIQRALDVLEQDTASLPAIFSAFAPPGRVPAPEAPAIAEPSAFPVWPALPPLPAEGTVFPAQAPDRQETFEKGRQNLPSPLPAVDRARAGPPPEAVRQAPPAETRARRAIDGEPQGMRRSFAAVDELRAVYRDIARHAAPAGRSPGAAPDALAVAPAAMAAVGAPSLPAPAAGSPAAGEAFAVPGPVLPAPGPVRDTGSGAAATPVPAEVKALKKTFVVPTIIARVPALPLAAEQAGPASPDADRLASALAGSVENASASSRLSNRGPADEKPPERAGRAGEPAMPPSPQAPPEAAGAVTPAAAVARSFAVMGDCARASAGMGRTGIPAYDVAGARGPAPAAGMLLEAMASAAPVAALPVPAPAPPREPAGYPDDAPGGFAPGGMPQALAPAAGLAAARAMHGPGLSMVQQLLQSAPRGPGLAGAWPPPSAGIGPAFDLWGTPPASPALASGAESVVNITVPPPQPARVVENTSTSKVSSFHNTFNITVTVRGGEERDLKELGRKIGQILSDEMKRYGGIG